MIHRDAIDDLVCQHRCTVRLQNGWQPDVTINSPLDMPRDLCYWSRGTILVVFQIPDAPMELIEIGAILANLSDKHSPLAEDGACQEQNDKLITLTLGYTS